MKLIFATHNENKTAEVRNKLSDQFEVVSLKDLNYTKEIVESGSTLEENALIKARTIFDEFQMPCFADDTGLEVNVLNGAPGVYSARYAGPSADSMENMKKLWKEMKGADDRSARFCTVICYFSENGSHQFFRGTVNGRISKSMSGAAGFGYDPIFIPEDENRSFAEMSAAEKNSISHRGRAIQEFVQFLLSQKS